MSKTIAFFNLIRFKNLVIIALTQFVIKYSLINYFVNDFVLSDFNFSLLVFATVVITAAGYIINDIYDVDADKINKNESVIIDKYISTKQAVWWYFAFNIVGLVIGVYLAFIVGSPILSIIFIYSIYSLWTYSKKYKKSLLIGNIQVAFLTSLSILNLVLFDVEEFSTLLINLGWMIYSYIGPDTWGYFIREEYIEPISYPIILYIFIFYAGFSFLITFSREIIKDIEDYTGDLAANAKTLVIAYGVRHAKQLAILLIVIVFILIAFIQFFQYSKISKFENDIFYWGVNNIAIIYIICIQLLFVYLTLKIYNATHKKDFYFISQLCKFIMIFGILSIPLFSYLHLN